MKTMKKQDKNAHLKIMKNKSILIMRRISKEEMYMGYTKIGYKVPLMVMEKEILPNGKYARMRLHYLKENKKEEYTILLMNKELAKDLEKTQTQATEMVQKIIQELATKEKTTEELKAQAPMKWTGLMNNYKQIPEEQVMEQIIYR